MSGKLRVGFALCLLSTLTPALPAFPWSEAGLEVIYSINFEPADPNLAMSLNVFIPRKDSCNDSAGRICESLVGNTVADALRATYGTNLAIQNSGGCAPTSPARWSIFRPTTVRRTCRRRTRSRAAR